LQIYPASDDQTWTEDDLAVITAITEQLAQAAENLRLFEETHERASREQTIREITDKVRAAPNIDRLLETAARELGQHLGVRHTVLELGIDLTSSTSLPNSAYISDSSN
jgi:GAF domain-containing protein